MTYIEKYLLRLLCVLTTAFPGLSIVAQRQQSVIRYGEDDRNNLLISYWEGKVGNPIIVWFHGGGLVAGNAFIPKELEDSEYVIISPNYRLLPGVEIDSCIDDAAAAVAWTFRNGRNYGGDTSKIFVAGHSAGGYLASMVGLDKSWMNRYSCDADSIAALIPFSGQAITHYEWRKIKGGSELRPTIDRYAPIYHIRKDAPPYIIICGDRNLELFGRYEENAYMWRMMKLLGHPDIEIYELDGYNHGDMASPAFHILKKTINRIIKEHYE